MTEDEIKALTERLVAMPEHERIALDPICEALFGAWSSDRPGIMVKPNRVVALAALDLAKAFHETVMHRE